jgi:mannose-6-phosphate isomerase-like protein (cupin superfamily)
MERRNFLSLPLVATASAIAHGAELTPARRNRGFRVGARQDRYDEELQIMGGRFTLKVSGQDTGGDLCIYDTVRSTRGGPALHRHFAQDEWFYVVRGEFVVRVGEDTLALHPGDSAFAPRTIPHAFAMTSEGEGQLLVLFQPAGSMEDFFTKMARFGKEIPANQEVVMKQLWADHGMEVLGPPLSI